MISSVKIWRRQKVIRKILCQKGKIISWTKIFVPGADFKKFAPYFLVLVELENKEKVVGQLVDFEGENLSFGLQVKAILRRVKETKDEDIIPYGIKFKLL